MKNYSALTYFLLLKMNISTDLCKFRKRFSTQALSKIIFLTESINKIYFSGFSAFNQNRKFIPKILTLL